MSRRFDSRRDLVRMMGADRLNVFVPAVMSIGLLFWLFGEARELLRDNRNDARAKRAALGAASVVASVRSGRPASPALGRRPRAVYAVGALALAVVSIYLSVGLFLRQRLELRDAAPGVSAEAWLLSLSTGAACVLLLYALSAVLLASRAPTPPWAAGVAARSVLTTRPVDPAQYPGTGSRRVRLGFLMSAISGVALAVLVASVPGIVSAVDERLADLVQRNETLDVFAFLDPLGKTEVMLVFAVLAGLAALRCRVLGAAYAAATAVGLLLSVTVRPVVARARPPTGHHAGLFDSFPSGHIVLTVLFAGAMPLAIAALLDRRWVIRPLRVLMAMAVIATGIHRVSSATHWPTDVLGGVLFGLALAFGVEWAVETERSHRLCAGCLWSHEMPRRHERGVFAIAHGRASLVRLVAHLTAAAAARGLAVLAATRGVPTSADGFVFPEAVLTPVQLGFAGLVSLGALIAWKWDAVGAVVLAIAAVGLGVFASVQYEPAVAVSMTAALLLPAVLLWVGWQHRRRPHEIVALAVVTALLLGGTWLGARRVYAVYFGPTHPASAAPLVSADRVQWMWAGGLAPDEVTVVARLDDDAEVAQVEFRAAGVPTVVSADQPPGDHHIVRLRVDGLRPGTEYAYRMIVDGRPDEGRGVGSLRTPLAGPMSFRVAVSSCARVGANGAVFDAIGASDPLLYVVTGDIHYGNIDSTSTGPYYEAWDRLLTEPGQAALYADVPIAYVWDDHDYGGNDADASLPGRSAVREVYRDVVPHYDVPPGDAPINQAFTIGRIRFVMTDTRSERTGASMLGREQLDWLLDELRRSSPTHAAVVWVNSVPWIGAPEAGADTWAGYSDERRQIADAIAKEGIDNLLMVSGDAHMVAIDDGSNSGYATDGTPGFAVLQAAALDRPGNVKGGPYSEGTFPGGGQFGLIDVSDDGGTTVTVRLSGHTWDGRQLVALTLEFEVVAPG